MPRINKYKAVRRQQLPVSSPDSFVFSLLYAEAGWLVPKPSLQFALHFTLYLPPPNVPASVCNSTFAVACRGVAWGAGATALGILCRAGIQVLPGTAGLTCGV